MAQTAFKGNENRLFELREQASAKKSMFSSPLDVLRLYILMCRRLLKRLNKGDWLTWDRTLQKVDFRSL